MFGRLVSALLASMALAVTIQTRAAEPTSGSATAAAAPGAAPATIVILPPEVIVYQQGVGTREPVPQWTDEAQAFLTEAARTMLSQDSRFAVVDTPSIDEAQRETFREHVELFKIVAFELGGTVRMGGKAFQQNRDYPDYRIGTGLKFLRDQTDAKYAFVIAGAELRQTGGSVFMQLALVGLTGV